jgi:hypothetical protein
MMLSTDSPACAGLGGIEFMPKLRLPLVSPLEHRQDVGTSIVSIERMELQGQENARDCGANLAAWLVVLMADGLKWAATRAKLGCHDRYVERWSNRFESDLMAGVLVRPAAGARYKITDRIEARVFAWTIKHHPADSSTRYSPRRLNAELGAISFTGEDCAKRQLHMRRQNSTRSSPTWFGTNPRQGDAFHRRQPLSRGDQAQQINALLGTHPNVHRCCALTCSLLKPGLLNEAQTHTLPPPVKQTTQAGNAELGRSTRRITPESNVGVHKLGGA